MMTEDEFYRTAYNAHEWAESAAYEAMRASLEKQSDKTLMCLADPKWYWETRSWISAAIIDQADDILTQRLEVLVS